MADGSRIGSGFNGAVVGDTSGAQRATVTAPHRSAGVEECEGGVRVFGRFIERPVHPSVFGRLESEL